MSETFGNTYENSEFLQDASEASTQPVNGELYGQTEIRTTTGRVKGIEYVLGLPGLRGGVAPAWGTNVALTGTAVSASVTVTFSLAQDSYLTQGMMICGASPTSTGFREITGGSGTSWTVNSGFDVDLASETAYRHGTVAERMADLTVTVAAIESVILKHQVATGTAGGALTSGAWITRTLNTIQNPDGFTWATLTSNQFTLNSGTYFLNGWSKYYATDNTQTRIYNSTDAAEEFAGDSELITSAQSFGFSVLISGRLDPTTQTTYELQARCATANGTSGQGLSRGFTNEVYAYLEIQKR